MIDFVVPNDPEWLDRFEAKHGSNDGEILAISPAMLELMTTAQSSKPRRSRKAGAQVKSGDVVHSRASEKVKA